MDSFIKMSFDQRLFLQKKKGRWTADECKRFEDAYFTYGNKWKLIARAVGSRSLIQIRSHAQKVVHKLEERGPTPPDPKDQEPEAKPEPPRTPKNPIRSIQDHSKMYETWLYHTMKAAQTFRKLKEYNRDSAASISPPEEENPSSSANPERTD